MASSYIENHDYPEWSFTATGESGMPGVKFWASLEATAHEMRTYYRNHPGTTACVQERPETRQRSFIFSTPGRPDTIWTLSTPTATRGSFYPEFLTMLLHEPRTFLMWVREPIPPPPVEVYKSRGIPLGILFAAIVSSLIIILGAFTIGYLANHFMGPTPGSLVVALLGCLAWSTLTIPLTAYLSWKFTGKP